VTGLHEFDQTTDQLADALFQYALGRVKTEPPLNGPRTPEELWNDVGQTITEDGIGNEAALAIFTDHLAPACLPADHPRFLAFVPGAPSAASSLFDLVVGASSMCANSWLEAAGAVYAENQALRWVADLVGLPDEAGGCFASGGTMGNLSALVTARDHAQRRHREQGIPQPNRWAIMASDGAHSSIASAARVLGVDVVQVPTDDERRLRGKAVEAAFDGCAEGSIVATPLLSTHINGCSHHSTAVRFSTESPPSPKRPIPSMPATSNPSIRERGGTRRITATFSLGGPGVFRSGFRWLYTEPGPMPTQSNER